MKSQRARHKTARSRPARGWILGATTPDYQLTPAAPLWVSFRPPSDLPSPTASIHLGVEVGVVLAGREEVEVGGATMGGGPGEVWLCAMSEPHRLSYCAPQTEALVLVFLPCFLGEEVLGSIPWLALFAPPPAERPRATEAATRRALLEIGQLIRAEAERKDPRWQYGVRLELLRLLFHLSRTWSPPAPTRAQGRAYSGNLSRIMPALTRLYEQPATELSRAEAARACDLGRSRFTALFSETMGDSFVTVRQRIRLARAAALLWGTGASVEEIAEQCGFSDASHLHRCFVKEHGCTPGQYRDRAQARTRRPS